LRLAATSRPQFSQPIRNDIFRIASQHLATTEQVRVTSIAPPINGGEVEIARRRVGLWKSACEQVRQHRLKLAGRLAEAAVGRSRLAGRLRPNENPA